MPITLQTPREAIAKAIAEKADNIKTAIIERLQEAGEECINIARTGHTYIDRTGNLTSSIGYIIVSDGEVIHKAGFTVVNQGDKGSANGKLYAEDIASQFSHGIVLIVVAGMNYAKYVSAKGYDVLDSAELSADSLALRLIDELRIKQ